MKWAIPKRDGRAAILLLPLAWLAVVVVVAGLTWQVIDSAGRNVLVSGDSSLSASGTTSDARSAPSSAGPTPGGGEDERSESPRPSETAGPGSDAPPTPSATRTPGQQPVPSPSSPSTPDSDEPQLRSWQGSAGTVTASCTGTAISFRSTSAYDGWAFEVDERGPRRVRVEFTSGGDDGRETEVEAECSGGAPSFQVESND